MIKKIGLSLGLCCALLLSHSGLVLAADLPATQLDKRTITLPSIAVSAAASTPLLLLDVVATTASRLGLTPRETPASVTIVDRAMIEQRGATDTQEILKSVPGMLAASPPGSAGSVSYRGFGASSLTQMFNGITVQYDAVAARPVDSWIYDRVEVVGGPSTFLFGAGAVGGSINNISKIASRAGDFTEARASYGSYASSQISLGFNRRLGAADGVKNYVRADVNRSNSNGYVDGNKREAWTGAFSLLTDITPDLSHTLALEYQNENVDRPYWGTPLLNPASGAIVGNGRIDAGTRFKNYNSADGVYEQTVRWARSIIDFRVNDKTTLRNTFYHYDALRDFRNVEVYKFANASNASVLRSSPLLQRHDQAVNGERFELMHQSSLAGMQSDWAAGFDYSINKQTRFPRSGNFTSTVNPYNFATEQFFNIPGMAPIYTPQRTNKVETLAFFVENRTKLSQQLSLVTGLRHDNINLGVTNHRTISPTDPAFFERTYRPTTGRVGLVFDITPTSNVYVQYSTAADPPAGILTTASLSNVRDFDLTTGKQVEVGSKFDFLNGRGSATMAAYKIVRKNLAVTDPSNINATLAVGQQSSQGIELAASLLVTDKLTAQANFSIVDAQYDRFTESVSGVAVSRAGNTPINTPDRVANTWLNYQITPQLQAGVDARYVSARFGDTANTFGDAAYTLFGAFASYQLPKQGTLTARVRNLTDKVYAASITSTPMFYLGAPRTFEVAWQTSF